MAAFEVPIATGLFTGIPHDIATAPGAMLPGQAIGNLADAYWSGQNQAYLQRNRDLFKNGIPADLSTALLQAQGAAGVPEYIALQKLKLGQELNTPIPGEYGSTYGANASTPAGSAVSAAANESPTAGTATARQIATARASEGVTLDGLMKANPDITNPDAPLTFEQRQAAIDNLRAGRAPASGQPARVAAAGATTTVPTSADAPVAFSGRFPGITTTPGGASGITPPPRVPLPPSVGAANPAQPQAVPAQTAQAQPPIAQAQAGPSVDQQVAEMQRQRAIADEAFKRGRAAASIGDDALAKQFNSRAEAASNVANDINKSLLERAMPTKTQMEVRDPAVATAARTAEINKLRDAQAEKVYAGIRAAATQYERDLKPYTDLGTAILSDPRTYTGIGANAVLDFNKIRANYGDAKAAMMQEAVQKLNAASVLSQINTQKDQMQEAGSNSSRLFSSQVEQVEKASANMGNTIQGNRFLLNVQQHMGEMSVEVARQAREYRAKYGVLDDGFDTQISKYLQKHPVFSDLERARPDILGAPTVPPGAKDWSKEQAAQWGREHGLKPGEVARVSNGVYLTIPRIDVYRKE